MITSLTIKSLTVFPETELRLGTNLNVFIGENGTGKTHLLKLIYTLLATSWEEGRKPTASNPTKTQLQIRLAEKLIGVFRPETLGRLVRRKQGRERCDIQARFTNPTLDISFGFATNSKSEVSIASSPSQWLQEAPVYIPTRELLSIFPNFISIYDGHYLELEETWRDTCLLLGALLPKGPKERQIQTLLEPLEQAMQGKIELDNNGRFYLRTSSGRMEMHLVAEGLRKLGMIARLIATGALLNKGFLFWDEPEANLNPRLTKEAAKTIVDLSKKGIQVFMATHSLFLLRELDMLLHKVPRDYQARFIGIQAAHDDQDILIEQSASIDDIGSITALEEELSQSDRYLNYRD